MQFYQTALENCYGLKLPKCSLKNKFIVSFIIIFGTFSVNQTKTYLTDLIHICLRWICFRSFV